MKTTNRHNLFAILLGILLLCIQTVFAQNTQETDSAKWKRFPYVYVVEQGSAYTTEISDSAFYHDSRGIIFPVNKFYLPKNNEWIREQVEKVAPWARENDLELKFVEMRGASSPEGPIKWNNTLAKNRSQALQDTLQKIYNVRQTLIDTSRVENPEDYKALLFLMREKNDPDLERVESILKKHNFQRVPEKKELMSVDGGRLWKRLLKEYYPEIRYARVILFFERKKEEKPEEDVPDDIPLEPTDEEPEPEEEEPEPPVDEPEPEDDRIPRRHLLAVRSNLIYDGFYFPRYGWAPSPNIAIEYFPKNGRLSYNFELTYPDWEHYSNHHFWQIHDYNLAVRLYTRKNKVAPKDVPARHVKEVEDYFQGLFVGAYVNAGRYGIGWSTTQGWEGEYAGGGLTAGYTLPLTKSSRWRLELTASFGFMTSKYDPYIYGNPISGEEDGLYYYDWHHSADYFIKRNHRWTWLGPTGAGIHITYDLLYRRKTKKTPSLKRWELKY